MLVRPESNSRPPAGQTVAQLTEALKSGVEPLASTSAYVAEADHQAKSGANGNPGSPQEDTAQPAEIAEPMESLAEGEPLEITLPVNPLSSSTGCTLHCDEVQSEIAAKEVASQKWCSQKLQKESPKSK